MESLARQYAAEHETSLLDNMQMFKALSDETRLRILGLLSDGELCVCDIMAVLELPQSTASRHLAYLRHSNWVFGTRRGKWMYYRLAANISDNSVHHRILQYLAGLTEVRADRQKLTSHLAEKDKKSCS